MITLKLLSAIFILFFISRAYLRFKDKSLNTVNFIFWSLVWILALAIIFNPNLSELIAKPIGLGRGMDAIFMLSIILLFYLIFRLYVKIDRIDKDVTQLAISTSKALHAKEKNNS